MDGKLWNCGSIHFNREILTGKVEYFEKNVNYVTIVTEEKKCWNQNEFLKTEDMNVFENLDLERHQMVKNMKEKSGKNVFVDDQTPNNTLNKCKCYLSTLSEYFWFHTQGNYTC